MKKLFLLLLGAVIVCASHAQIVEQGEPALVYYSPKTAVVLDFTYTIEKEEKGIYAEYAEELIGLKEAIKENKTTYSLESARIGTATYTDYSRPHKVSSEAGFPMLLSINEKGLLTGYNLPMADKQHNRKKDEKVSKTPKKEACPVAYPEEVVKASGIQAQAQAAAQQIYHLRETRMYIMNGEVENAPADGKAMQLVLEELEREEQQLVALFYGKRSTSKAHKRVEFAPEKGDVTLFFSEENGFTDAENIEADTVKVHVVTYKQEAIPTVPAVKKDKKKPVEVSPIVYNLPGNGEISVHYQAQEIAKRNIPIAQLGIDVPLAKDLFTGSTLPVIVISEKTGNIISISE